jgi:replicative DNA helicase
VTEAEVIIAKNRMLPIGVVKCGFHGRMFKFVARSEMNEPGQKKS